MDPNLLRTFVAVARCGSFSAAARELGYTQSAVSQQVAALETDLGVALLHRRPVGLTDAGTRLLEHAGPLLLRLGAARSDVKRLAGAPPARLSLGMAPLADIEPATSALIQLRQSMPRVSFTLRVAGRDTISAAIAAADLDLGLVDGVTAPSDPLRLLDAGLLTTSVLVEETVVIALPVGHPMATRPHLRLEDLADAGWLDAVDIVTPLAHLRALARTDGFRPGLTYEGTDVRALLALVAADAGLVLLPLSIVDGHPGLVGVPLVAPRLVHRTELIHASLAGPALAMASMLQNRRTV